MEEPSGPAGTVRFGAFAVDLRAGELRKNGHTIRLPEQPFQVLSLLLEHAGEVVTRDELRQGLWPADTFVDFDHGLNNAIKKLRDVLDDSAESPRYIETLPKRGYRFIYPMDGAAVGSHPAVAWWRERWVVGLLAAVVLLAALLMANIGGLRERLFGTSSRLPVASLAVLPLENLTGDAEQEYFVDGIHDELITQLAQISSLKVISRYSVVRIKQEKGKSLQDIARELGVDAVMEGTVQRAGDRIHLSVQVIRAQDDRHLWARSYDREFRDMPRLPADIARAMAGDLAIKVAPQEQTQLARQNTVDPEVYKLYLKGQYYRHQWKKDSLDKALEYFRQAIDLDPTYAPAWSGLGVCYQRLSPYGDREETRGKARAALRKALELDEKLSQAHRDLAQVYMDDWDWKSAEREILRAEELDPNWPGDTLYFARLGLFDEAILVQRAGTERNPLGFASNLTLGWVYFMARRYDDAIPQLKKALQLDPNNRMPHYQLAWNYAKKGMFKDAIAECDAYSQPDPEVGGGDDCGWVYALAGQRAKAFAFMERVRRKPKGGPDQTGQFARVHDALGDRETAIKLLYEKYNKHLGHFGGIKLGPIYSDELRADPRFQELVRRAGFPEPSPALVARARGSLVK